ncbi:MAG: S8 family serine peptidase [Eubacteriaceae bacterium]|nr:S8 family serine peptidase [Eubacteriaceae bacterium]
MRIKRFSLFLTMLLMLLSISSVVMAQSSDSVSKENPYQPGEAIVCITRSAARSMADDELLGASESLLTLSGNAGDIQTAGEGDITELRLVRSNALSTEEIIKQLKAKPGVRYAEPNYLFSVEQSGRPASEVAQSDSSDSAYTGDFTSMQYANTGDNSIDVPDWNNPENHNADGIVVAVLDSGVNYNHEDLAPVMWDKGLDYPALTALGGGKYGVTIVKRNSEGKPYDSEDPMDDHSHGSHCAGSIGAAWNGKGVSGAANGVSVMSVKIANNNGAIEMANIIKGFQYVIAAVDAGVNVKVTSNSYNGPPTLAGHDAVKAAAEKGVVTVKSAGNEWTEIDYGVNDSSVLKKTPETVVVGASDHNGEKAFFSNFGQRTTDVFAPGFQIFSTILTDGGDIQYTISKPTDGTEDTFNPDKQRLYTGVPTDAACKVKQGEIIETLTAKAEDSAVSVEGGKGLKNSGAMVVANAKGTNAAIHVTGTPQSKSGQLLSAVRATASGTLHWADPDGRSVGTVQLPENKWTDFAVDAKYFTDESVFFFQPKDEGTAYEVAVDGMYLSDDKPDYGMMSGTSMATPAVAGEAAILCARYPDDNPGKIAARIKGSVNPKDNLADACVSGGIASARKALEGDTMPVLNDCLKAGDNTCVLSGYFFGDSGTLTVDGKTIQPSSWSDTAITFAYDDGAMKGEHVYAVTASSGKTGRQYFTLQNSDHLMDRLPTPDDPLFKNSMNKSSCGLDGKIYFIMYQELPEKTSSLWSYTPGDGGGWEKLSAKLPFEYMDGKMCAWNHKLLIPCVKMESETEGTLDIAVYDPKTGDARYIDVTDTGNYNFSLINTGDRVYAYYCVDAAGSVKQPMLGIVDPRNLTFQPYALTPSGVPTQTDATPTAGLFADDAGHLFAIGGFFGDYYHTRFTTRLDLVNPDADVKDRMTALTDDVFGDGFPSNQDVSPIAAEPVEGGAIISGLVKTDESGHVVADTFKLNTGAVNTAADGGDIKLEPIDKRVSDTKVSAITGTVYDNHFYTLGFTDNDMTSRVFTDYPVSGSNNAGDSNAPSMAYEVHGRDYGWEQGEKRDGQMAGTTGKALRLEAMRISVKDDAGDPIDGLGVTYRVHMKDIGWGSWTDDGLQAGTVGKCTRLEAAEIKLTGEKAGNYDIYYRVHMAYKGWGDWVKNGEMAGTTGECRRIEAIEMKIVPKGGAAPTE